MPVIPHFASECLKLINSDKQIWPDINEQFFKEEFANIVIQINGKKRGLIKAKVDISETELCDNIMKDTSLMKYFESKKIERKIYIKNKLINFIIV